MYESHFALAKRPFASVCQVEQYFAAASIEAARSTLQRCLERGEGAGMVVGPSGTGKTMLLRVLGEQFRDSFAVALLDCGRLSSRRALFQTILHEMDERIRGLDEGELRLALIDTLTIAPDRPRGLILLVDEAHTLPLSLLEEIRMLTNLANEGQPAVRVALAGSCLLEERFANPKLDSFSQRIVARSYLEAMNRTETRDYVRSQIERVGGDAVGLFDDDACEAIYNATGGVPRPINQVCDHALVLAYADATPRIDSAGIQEAWADLQQLPTPWNDDEPAEGGVIEFGGLDDSPLEVDVPGDGVASIGELIDEPIDDVAAIVESDADVLTVGELVDEPDEPAIRIVPETTIDLSDEADPAARVERIESLLAGVDKEFDSPAPDRPVLELVFDDPDDLLAEPFEDEEIIRDRFTPVREEPPETVQFSPGEPEADPLDSTAPSDGVSEQAWEPEGTIDEELPASFEAPEVFEPPAAEDTVEEAWEPEQTIDEELPVSFEAREVFESPAAEDTVEEPVADWSASVALVESISFEPEQLFEWASPVPEPMSGVLPFEAEAVAASMPGEPEATNVACEEDPTPPAAPARRQSYSRLFAKLRYG